MPKQTFHHVKTRLLLRRSFTNGNSFLSQVKHSWSHSKIVWYPIPIGLGIVFIGITHFFKVKHRQDQQSIHTQVQGPWHIRLYASLPLRYISQCWGYINDITIPRILRAPIYKFYSLVCGCLLDEMEESDLTKFENLGQFFYRTIKPSVRTIVSKNEASLISPSDGTILHFGNVNHDEIEQVKGVTYSLNALLGPNPNSNRNPLLEPTYEAKENSKLFFTVIYLAPGDYHRFHSPTEWKIHTMRHFAGEMFSVSPFLVSRLRHLFSLNERVSLLGQWDYGMFCMVAVAATNVGKIILNSCPNLMTNVPNEELDRPLGTAIEERLLKKCGNPIDYVRGMEMGGFKLGSTLVLVFEAPESFTFSIQPGQKIRLGEALGNVIKS